MRFGRSLSIVLLLLQSLSLAADKKQLTTAIAAVEANVKTPAGKKYDAGVTNDFQKYAPSVRQCKQVGSPSDFDIFLRLRDDGVIQAVLVYPETPFSNCTQNALLNARFSSPPHADYWVNIHCSLRNESHDPAIQNLFDLLVCSVSLFF